MSDEEFMVDLLSQITEYARKKGYSVDDTIEIISNNLLNLLEIVTFDNLEKGEKEE